MKIPPLDPKNATFLTSVVEAGSLPRFGVPEVIFLGASNVGKSTLINALARQKNLARTSKTPGRTQLLNFFWLPQRVVLADAPGYGFAQTPEEVRENWQGLMLDYFEARAGSLQAYVLMDSRRWVRPHDTELMRLLQSFAVPYVLVFTKVDKLSKTEQCALQQRCQEQLGEACPVLVTSAKKREGLEALSQSLRAWGRSAKSS